MSNQANGQLQEVERCLRARVKRDPAYKAFREKTTKLTVLGLRLPIMREIEVAGFSFYSQSQDKILNIWNRIWMKASTHEVMSLPLFYYRRHKQDLDLTHWKRMKHWIERVENWEHADALCQLYSIFLSAIQNSSCRHCFNGIALRIPGNAARLLSRQSTTQAKSARLQRSRPSCRSWSHSSATATRTFKKLSVGNCARPTSCGRARSSCF